MRESRRRGGDAGKMRAARGDAGSELGFIVIGKEMKWRSDRRFAIRDWLSNKLLKNVSNTGGQMGPPENTCH